MIALACVACCPCRLLTLLLLLPMTLLLLLRPYYCEPQVGWASCLPLRCRPGRRRFPTLQFRSSGVQEWRKGCQEMRSSGVQSRSSGVQESRKRAGVRAHIPCNRYVNGPRQSFHHGLLIVVYYGHITLFTTRCILFTTRCILDGMREREGMRKDRRAAELHFVLSRGSGVEEGMERGNGRRKREQEAMLVV